MIENVRSSRWTPFVHFACGGKTWKGRTEWRGKVQHVLSGEARYFRDWATLIKALQKMLRAGEVWASNNKEVACVH